MMWHHMPMMGGGYGFAGWIINLIVIGLVVYFAVSLALKHSNIDK